MELRYLAVLGFGCSGNTAVADCLLESELFEAYADYEEIDDLRDSNGLIAIYDLYAVNKFKSSFIIGKIFFAFLRFLIRFLGFIRFYFLRNFNGNYKKKFRNFLKALRYNWLFVKTLFWFYRHENNLNNTQIVKFYLSALKKECCINGSQIFLANNVCFPEFLSEEILLAFPDNLKMIISIRDAYDSFCDMELNEQHFHQGKLGHEFILGKDKGFLLRRINFINVLKYRINQVSQLIDLYPSKIIIIQFENLVEDYIATKNLLLNFCNITELDFKCKKNSSRNRYFDPNESVTNIRSYETKSSILNEFGYTPEMLAQLDQLNEMYKNLKSKCTLINSGNNNFEDV